MIPAKISGQGRRALFQDWITDSHVFKGGAVNTKYSTVVCFVWN